MFAALKSLKSVVKVLLLAYLTVNLCEACDTTTQVEFLNGCGEHEGMEIMVPSTGFIIASENCGLLIPKETFEEQPHVFYTNAGEDAKYTLIMVEEVLDSSSGEQEKRLQWLVSEIPVNIFGF